MSLMKTEGSFAVLAENDEVEEAQTREDNMEGDAKEEGRRRKLSRRCSVMSTSFRIRHD